MLPNDRVSFIPGKTGNGTYILYIMQQSQRCAYNPSLNHAIDLSNYHGLPLIVVFRLLTNVPDANMRHYHFMFQGLTDIADSLGKQGISFFIVLDQHEMIFMKLIQKSHAVITDTGYLIWQRDILQSYQNVAKQQAFYRVEGDVVVPITVASNKEEYSAATLRLKLLPKLSLFLHEQGQPSYNGIHHYTPYFLSQAPVKDNILDNSLPVTAQTIYDKFQKMNNSLPQLSLVLTKSGGYKEASRTLDHFITTKLINYADSRNIPGQDCQSDLSPYLHFGHISPVEIAMRVLIFAGLEASHAATLIKEKNNPIQLQRSIGAFLEELIVRRELSCNFCYYNRDYGNYKCIPSWARMTLTNHQLDAREHTYPLSLLETAETDDILWNAAQTEMVKTGKMHGYMRMYWGKKIIEWSPEPEYAFDVMIYLNNKYELDGRDPNAYAGIAWCFGKHDRPWQERSVFGMIRYMNAAGLKRKYDMDLYVKKVGAL